MTTQNREFYLTIEHPCAYYAERVCQNVIPDPKMPMHAEVYDQLAVLGFRRSGGHVYRPHCPDCHDCIPCRVRVTDFKPTRSQRRCLNKNSDVVSELCDAEFNDEYFELYQRYLNQRHSDGDMKNPSEEDFRHFLICDWSNTRFLTLREHGKLLAVAVMDKVANGYSAVYTFYDPELHSRGLGTLAILRQIELCRELNLPYLYLGYWLDQHPKMHYKIGFDATELYLSNHWIDKNRLGFNKR